MDSKEESSTLKLKEWSLTYSEYNDAAGVPIQSVFFLEKKDEQQ